MWEGMILLLDDGTTMPYWSCSAEVHDDSDDSLVAGCYG